MQRSMPEHYRVADFLGWNKNRQLKLNPDFQRRYIWTDDVKSYFIDTILVGYPIPKVYLRTEIDPKTHGVLRDVVDGQQRIRTILDFANGDLRLNKRGGEHRGMRWEDLGGELQSEFLAYQITAEQLVEASDEDVLEMFARLNTYSVPLSPAEKRHAKYQGEFKFIVRALASGLSSFWDNHKILTTRERLRMLDDQLAAEMLGVLIDGVKNGGAPYLDKLYGRFNKELPGAEELAGEALDVIDFIEEHFAEAVDGELFSRPPQFLMLFAAVAHAQLGLPQGDLKAPIPPQVMPADLDLQMAASNLARLTNTVVAPDLDHPDLPAFASAASSGASVRIDGRETRFRHIWGALTGTL